MSPGMASDEVTDAIAHIEMHRQETQKESGLAAACSEALRKLHELLASEQAAAQPHEPGAGHLANIEAVMIEIKRVTKLAGIGSQGAILKRSHTGQRQQAPRPGGPRNPQRNKGRRTMGRRGDR
jgi:bacterioferritin-associated ferredoxin